MRHLDLYFPDWQPSGSELSLFHGAKMLRELLDDRCAFEDVSVETDGPLIVEDSILGRTPILRQLRACRKLVTDSAPASIFSIGGTCGIEVVPISYLNRLTDGNLTVVWFDAHGDLNTPATSPSNHFHGMVARTLLGDGDSEIRDVMFSTISPAQLILAGIRDLDPEEEDFLRAGGIASLGPKDLRTPDMLLKMVEMKKCGSIYVHIDFDVLDPVSFPHVHIPVDHGIETELLIRDVKRLASCFDIVGASLVELHPMDASWMPTAMDLCTVLRPGTRRPGTLRSVDNL